MNSEILKKVFTTIENYQSAMIQMQTELTGIPALSPENNGTGENEKADYLKKYLKTTLQPDSLEQIDAPDSRVPAGFRPNLLARFNGKNHRKTIWIMSHLDVVPPGEASLWHTDPYKVVIKNGKLFGRGVEDNQQGLVGSVFAVKALKDLGIMPEYDIGLAIVADEETGSKYGLTYVLKNQRDLFRKDDLIIVPDAGNGEGTMIEVAEKSILWLKFEVIGKQCHGSTPEVGINAHKAGAHLIVKLNQLYDIFKVSDPVFDPPISTFEPTRKEANVPNVNTIPGEDVFYFDCRVLPNYPLAEVEAEIQRMVAEIGKTFGVTVKISSPQREEAAPSTPTDAPVVEALKLAIKDVYKREAKTVGIGGGTVAAFFRRAGLNAAVWATLDEVAHQPNEYCILSNLINDTKVFAHIFLQE